MLGDILTGILGVVFLAGAVQQFRCKGPIWSAEYLAATKQERKRLRRRAEYLWSAVACLWIGLALILTMVYNLVMMSGFLYGAFVALGLLIVHIGIGTYRAVQKSTSRGPGSRKRVREQKNEETEK